MCIIRCMTEITAGGHKSLEEAPEFLKNTSSSSRICECPPAGKWGSFLVFDLLIVIGLIGMGFVKLHKIS